MHCSLVVTVERGCADGRAFAVQVQADDDDGGGIGTGGVRDLLEEKDEDVIF